MPQDPFEVLFCDLCSTSVPLADLERGAAVRHHGKTIGACCIGALRGTATPTPVAESVVAVASSSPAARAPDHADGRLLPIGIALLAAIAAATMYLDHRVGSAEDANRIALERMAEDDKLQNDALQKLTGDLDGVARKGDLDRVGERQVAADGELQQVRELLRTTADQHGKALATVQQALTEMRSGRVDYQPRLDQISQQLQQQAVALAELRAMPRLQPVESVPDAAPKPAEAAAPGVPAELAHQIKRLQDPDPATRFEAVYELLQTKNVGLLPHLLPMAQDVDTFVRRLTVDGLRDFKQATVVDALVTALGDPEEIVRDAAWRSLKDLTGQKFPFEATAGKEVRQRAQARWQEWWEKNRASFASS